MHEACDRWGGTGYPNQPGICDGSTWTVDTWWGMELGGGRDIKGSGRGVKLLNIKRLFEMAERNELLIKEIIRRRLRRDYLGLEIRM